MEEVEALVFKIALIGAHGTGKTALISKYHTNNFLEQTVPTVGANFVSHNVTIDNEIAELQIWDTAGQDRYKSIGPLYYRDALCCIGVYDVSRPDSLSSLDDYVEGYLDSALTDGIVVVVANKIDLDVDTKDEMISKGQQYAESRGFTFYEVSAKSGKNVNEVFEAVAKMLFSSSLSSKKNQLPEKKKKDGCC